MSKFEQLVLHYIGYDLSLKKGEIHNALKVIKKKQPERDKIESVLSYLEGLFDDVQQEVNLSIYRDTDTGEQVTAYQIAEPKSYRIGVENYIDAEAGHYLVHWQDGCISPVEQKVFEAYFEPAEPATDAH